MYSIFPVIYFFSKTPLSYVFFLGQRYIYLLLKVYLFSRVDAIRWIELKGSLNHYGAFKFGLSDIDLKIYIDRWKSYSEYKLKFDEIKKHIDKFRLFFPLVDFDVTCRQLEDKKQYIENCEDEFSVNYLKLEKLMFYHLMEIRNRNDYERCKILYYKK